MNQSSVVTGGFTFTAASLAPVVTWVLSGCPQPIPESVPLLISAALITIGHAVWNYSKARTENPTAKE